MTCLNWVGCTAKYRNWLRIPILAISNVVVARDSSWEATVSRDGDDNADRGTSNGQRNQLMYYQEWKIEFPWRLRYILSIPSPIPTGLPLTAYHGFITDLSWGICGVNLLENGFSVATVKHQQLYLPAVVRLHRAMFEVVQSPANITDNDFHNLKPMSTPNIKLRPCPDPLHLSDCFLNHRMGTRARIRHVPRNLSLQRQWTLLR